MDAMMSLIVTVVTIILGVTVILAAVFSWWKKVLMKIVLYMLNI